MNSQKSQSLSTFELLETRRLMSQVPVIKIPEGVHAVPLPGEINSPGFVVWPSLDAKGVLRVFGTASNDHVTIRRSGAEVIVFSDEFVIGRFDRAQVKKARVLLGDGDDVFAAKGAIRCRMTIEGGNGNDNLLGGAGHDRIDGGQGDDVIVGAEGTDELIGGTGRDVIDALTHEPLFLSYPPLSPTDIVRATDGEVDRIVGGHNELAELEPCDAKASDPGWKVAPFRG